mgnify:FL=1
MKRRVRKRLDHAPYLTQADLATVLRVCDLRLRALVLVLYTYALRVSEPGTLARTDWRAARRELYVRRCKGSISATHAVPDAVHEALVAWDATRPSSPWLFPGRAGTSRGISASMVRHLWRQAVATAGLSPRVAYPHVLKHSRCVHLRDAGARPEAIQQVAGHEQLTSTLRYFHLTEEDRAVIRTATDGALAALVR